MVTQKKFEQTYEDNEVIVGVKLGFDKGSNIASFRFILASL